MENINLDNIVDYKDEYSSVIQNYKIQGTQLTGLCPFHSDHNASFSVDLQHGLYKCFSCGEEGNFISFVAKRDGVSSQEAYKSILSKYHVDPVQPHKRTYTVSDYAIEKHLPESWLVSEFGLTSGIDSPRSEHPRPYIGFPYYDENHKKLLHRKRYPKGSAQRFGWSKGSSGKIFFYGEWYLPKIRNTTKSVILVEGESDTQTLIYLGYDVLGVPGASMFNKSWCKYLTGIDTIYIHLEPDNGGEEFLRKMIKELREGKYEGNVFEIRCSAYGCKDPSELYIQHGKNKAANEVSEMLKNAKPIDISDTNAELAPVITNQPLALRQPSNFTYGKNGVCAIDEKTGSSPVLICRTPLIITKRLLSLDTGDERMEIAFWRDGEWHTSIHNRSTLFQTKSLPTLADLGCTITSENAKYMVRYLERLEAENFDLIPTIQSTTSFGWIDSKRFIPGFAPGVELDIDPSLRSWASAYHQSGSLNGWVINMQPHRERNIFRFILSAAFSAPLLRILKQRIFFVYNWCNSKGGKSAALKAALSVWGDPERLMVNFNATQVALERMAGFYCDLPLGIDERQLAGNNQGALDKIVYMLASGTGRIRGSKSGGLQQLSTWRTVVLATGEEPIAGETSQTGVSTRILELSGAPFNDEQSASLMHQTVADNFGFAGEEFMKHLLAMSEDRIRNVYNSYFQFISEQTNGENGAHSAGIAAVATADFFVSQWIFGEDDNDASEHAINMIIDVIKFDRESAAADINETARQFVSDWIWSNVKCFGGDSYTQYGLIEGSCAYVYPTALSDALKAHNFSVRKTYKYFAEKGIIETRGAGDHDSYKIRKMINNVSAAYIKFDLNRLGGDGSEPQKNKGGKLNVANSDENEDFGEMPF